MAREKLCPECRTNTLDFPIEKEKNKCVICQNQDDGLIVGNFHEETTRMIIPAKVWAMLSAYCASAPGEVSGFGRIEFNEEEDALVTEVVLIEQEGNQGSTLMQEEEINKFLYYLVKRQQDPAEWNLWWHTHADGSVFWSPTDEENIQNIQNMFGGKLFSIVLNKANHYLARLDEGGEKFNVDVVVKPYKYYSKLYKKCRKQVKRMVKNRTFINDDNTGVMVQPGVWFYE